jgi:hypothetical protein
MGQGAWNHVNECGSFGSEMLRGEAAVGLMEERVKMEGRRFERMDRGKGRICLFEGGYCRFLYPR